MTAKGAEMEEQVVETMRAVVVLHLPVKSPPCLHRMRMPGRVARELTRQWRVWIAAPGVLAIRLRQGLPSRMVCYPSKAIERKKV